MGKRKMTGDMETFDYVIIGAGSAGSVLANRLSEDAGTSVCVLEAGSRDWHPYIHLPAGFIKTFHMKSINWAYQQEVGPWTGGRSIYAPRGKTLGGSSSINRPIYNRGQPPDFDPPPHLGNPPMPMSPTSSAKASARSGCATSGAERAACPLKCAPTRK